MKIEDVDRFEVGESVHARRFDDELVVLDLAHGEYYALDEVGARVWEGFAGGDSLSGVFEGLLSTYDVDRERLQEDVASFAGELVDKGLMRVCRRA